MNAVMLMMRDTLGPPLNTQVHWEARPSGPVPSRSSLTSHSFTSGAFPQIVVSAIVIVGHRVILFLWLALSSPRPAATPLLARRGAGGEDSGFPSPAHGGGVSGGGFSTTKGPHPHLEDEGLYFYEPFVVPPPFALCSQRSAEPQPVRSYCAIFAHRANRCALTGASRSRLLRM